MCVCVCMFMKIQPQLVGSELSGASLAPAAVRLLPEQTRCSGGTCLLLLLSPESRCITKWFQLYSKTPAIRMFIHPITCLADPAPVPLCLDAPHEVHGPPKQDTPEPPTPLCCAAWVEPPSPCLQLPLLVSGQTFHCVSAASERFRHPSKLAQPAAA